MNHICFCHGTVLLSLPRTVLSLEFIHTCLFSPTAITFVSVTDGPFKPQFVDVCFCPFQWLTGLKAQTN